MTCKISLCKSLRELLKHHLASIFTVCLVFFIKTIVFFLEMQSYMIKRDYTTSYDKEYLHEHLQELTLPNHETALIVILIGIFLAFDLFRYLHSKKQVDFYDSLPARRIDWFTVRVLGACLIFIVPFIVNLSLEIILMVSFNFFKVSYFVNVLWNLACMCLIYLATLFTGVLAMVVTGHPIVALFGFGVFSAYAPVILQYLFPTYASLYFDTYASSGITSKYLNYISPIGVAMKLVDRNAYDYLSYSYRSFWSAEAHLADFIAIGIFIVFVGVLTYKLFLRRPSEAAGRAIAFTKCNAIIRILLVIPLTLYLGLYLWQVASDVENLWMIFGFVVGTILLHGIIESIIQFDIRGLWTHKKQMIGCLISSIAIAFIFWVDLFGYDKYIPKLEQIDSIALSLGEYYELSEFDGISGDMLDDAYQLVQTLIPQSKSESEAESKTADDAEPPYKLETILIHVEYRLKNGVTRRREYSAHIDNNIELIDKVYASKEYKADICMLYKADWTSINKLTLSDGHMEVALHLTEEERDLLFETYIAEYTPLTYTQRNTSSALAFFTIDEEHSCYIYPEFKQTITLLNKYIQSDESIKHFGMVSSNPLEKYEILSIEIFSVDYPISITDIDVINELVKHIELHGLNSTKTYDYENTYDVGITLLTADGNSSLHGTIPKEIVKEYVK